MKIAFLSGGGEPGADGVGDYSRLIAREIVSTRPDISCCLVALNDGAVKDIDSTPDAGDGAAPIPRLRLPRHISWPDRAAHAAEFLTQQEADVVSLQFVPYAYNPKGIVSGLGQHLAPLAAGRRVHFMGHELWIGDDPSKPLKERLVGRVQRHYVGALLKSLKPVAVHTSNDLYMQRLTRLGWKPQLLPLFGNIPVISGTAEAWLYSQLQEAGVDITTDNRNQFWLAAFFGSLHPEWPPEPVFTHLREAAATAKRRVIVISAGRIGPGEALWQQMAQNYKADFDFVKLGSLPGERISQFFNTADFGFAATPYALIGKSGSAVAMLEHGLPVIVNRDDIAAPSNGGQSAMPPHLIKMDNQLPRLLTAGLKRGPAGSLLPEVARRMLESLGA